jgi:uncharacterized protein (TIGR02118 family)
MADIYVIYGEPKDPGHFDDYYARVHTPLARKMPKLRELKVSKGAVTVLGAERKVYLTARLSFDNMSDLRASMASPEGKAVAADVPNYASGGAEVIVVDTFEAM